LPDYRIYIVKSELVKAVTSHMLLKPELWSREPKLNVREIRTQQQDYKNNPLKIKTATRESKTKLLKIKIVMRQSKT